MSNKMALDALTAALDAMEHMANTLNNMDAVDEDEDAQHDAAFEAVRVAIAELKKPQKSRIVAAPMASYPEADQRFFNFWYGHMFEDLMQPPLVGIDHATARYIWNAAAIAALQAAPQGWRPIETAPKDGKPFLIWTKRIGYAVVHHDVDDPMPTNIVPSGHHLKIDDGKFEHPIRGDYPVHYLPLSHLPATPPKD